jgi:hypothetical protein
MSNTDKKIEAITRLMQADDSTDAPVDSVKWAKNLSLSRSGESRLPVIKRILATLQIDLRPGTAVFGERSASVSRARQMLFDAGDYAIDLRISGPGDLLEIKGQILGEGFGDAEIVLSNENFSRKTKANRLSEFVLPGIPAGKYRLTAAGNTTEITISELTLN